MIDERFDEKMALASDSNTSAEELENLATDNTWCIRVAVAKNLKTPAETLIRLATDDKLSVCDANYRLRDALVDNPNTPLLALKALANDYGVMYGVARHKNASIELIREMMNKYHNDIHIADELFARLRACEDQELLKSFADDELIICREAVAGNCNTPDEVRKKLLNDESIVVRRAAEPKKAPRWIG
ncbi:MAG: hypothetical protein J6K42_03845 [Clostridia bacterium]|nr:hypothetical protein [Clostridia bacterium]